ncbi:MAG: BtpA/SgcQ family protein [Phycisphaerales bacterium]|nr:BtpA/SgcQ family protein [Phycisphaerales bacterium]
MNTGKTIFGRDRALIGMVHVGALPGTPHARESLDTLADGAAEEAVLLAQAGFDGLIIENMHDRPYLRRDVGPEIVAGMTRIGLAVRGAVGETFPLGVQVLAGANRAALAVAQAIGAQFIRAEGFVFASVADEGLFDEADAGPLLRYRRTIGADGIAIFADIKKKHSAHAITGDVDIAATARAAEFFAADGLVVSGAATGQATSLDDLAAVRGASSLPVLVGSGANRENVVDLLAHADGVIIGSHLKQGGQWDRPIDAVRVREFVAAAQEARRSDRGAG